jgi:hypothetical protein
MFDSSVIKKTGQWWKMLAAFSGIVAGGVIMAIAFAVMNSLTAESFFVCMFVGMVFVFVSACFGCISIRCPSCGKRWIWEAVRKQPASMWLASLLGNRVCPDCGHPKESRTT